MNLHAARAVLPAEVANFLVQFSIYLHQQQAYPAGHPVLSSSASAAAMRLSSLLLDRDNFAIGVAGDRLVIDGASTDPHHPVLRDLAELLHRQQIGVLRLWRGVGPHELEDLVAAMASARTAERPLGLEANEKRWAHIRLERHAYSQLLLEGDEAAGRAASGTGAPIAVSSSVGLWMALASSALAGDATDVSDAKVPQVAQAIESRTADAEYDRVIVDYLLQLGREGGRSGDANAVKGQFQDLLSALHPDALRQLLRLGATLDQRRELVELAANDLPTSTVMLVLNAAAAESGQTISHTLLRILGKLSLQSSDGPVSVRPVAEAAVRDSVRRLLDQWTLADPNPTGHTRMLDELARSTSPMAEAPVPSGSAALRIIQMSLEIGVPGPMLQGAINDLIVSGEIAPLLALLKDATESPASAAAWDHLATPGALEQLLQLEEMDPATVESFLTRLGSRAAAPMLDALTLASSRIVRRRLLTWLRHLGPAIGPLLVERLPGSAWYVQRNLLGLIGSLPSLPEGFTLEPYAAHSESRVRREALKVMLRIPEHYEEGVLRAIRDEDPQIVVLGLTMAAENHPAAAGPAVLAALHRREWPTEIRVQAIRVLAFSSSPQVVHWLVAHTLVQGRWFRRNKLSARTPEVLAALNVLASRWSQDPRAAELLRLARESRDSAIREAASSPMET